MGGLKSDMPLTFATYAIGMLALCGFPLLFSGFWSKDGILEAAQHWSVAKAPFYMLVFGALLTAFYMTRQVATSSSATGAGMKHAHESPAVMTVPLAILAFFAMALGLIGTPAWPWFRAFLDGRAASFDLHGFDRAGLADADGDFVAGGVSGARVGLVALRRQARRSRRSRMRWSGCAAGLGWLRDRLYMDEFYGATVIAFYAWWARVADWLDRRVWGGVVAGVAWLFGRWAQLNRFLDTQCGGRRLRQGLRELATGGGLLSRVQTGACRLTCGCWRWPWWCWPRF